MKYNLWIDDIRTPPEGWMWAKTSSEAIDMFKTYYITEASFDHDLGEDDTTRRVVLWMAENDDWPEICHVHSANPVGVEWLTGMIDRYGPGVVR